MKNILIKHWAIVLIFFLSLFIIWPVFLPGYFSHHDDLQVMRIFEMRKCLEDLQIPCRWVPDMGYGYGFPLFNYYPVFPYYIGAIISFLTGFVTAAKILFLIPLVLGGISMYLLVKELSDEVSALVGGVLYLFAPYRAIDSFVRGAIAESFAIALIPMVFYFMLKVLKERSNPYLIGLVLSFSAFLLSHNVMVLIFMPLIVIWSIYFGFKQNRRNFKNLILGLILGIGLAAFFIIPAYLERSLVQSETLIRGDLDFRVHFVSAKQLFVDRFWGYGASRFGIEDEMSFQIGWPHWWLVIVLFLALVSRIYFIPKELLKKAGRNYLRSFIEVKNLDIPLVTILLGIFLLSLFMMHNRSAFIWEKITLLHYTQFPWRFLALTIFSTSILGGLLFLYIKKELKVLLAVVMIIITFVFNWGYFRPDMFYKEVKDEGKLSGEEFIKQQIAAIYDYLPKNAQVPLEAASNKPVITQGKGEVSEIRKRSDMWSFEANLYEDSQILIPVFNFPIWEIKSKNNNIEYESDEVGLINLKLASGQHPLTGNLINTPIRTIANIVSLISLVIFVVIIFFRKDVKNSV